MSTDDNAGKPAELTLAQQLAEIKQELKTAQTQASESKAYVENLQKVASGHKEVAPKSPNDEFLDHLLNDGRSAVQREVTQQLAQKAYFEGLQNKFKSENPQLEALQDEVFGMTNTIVQEGLRRGQTIPWEAAITQATNHYSDKQKRMMKLTGADAPAVGIGGLQNSRYHGSEVDYFAMDEKEFKKVMDQEDNARKRRNREATSFYGSGR